MQRRHASMWTFLILVRLLVALLSQSIIHPDEHFQNSEITASHAFDYDADTAQQLLRTWEWVGDKPCRSILPAYLSTGLAFQILKRLITPIPSGRALFLAQRLSMWCLSLLGDWAVWTKTRSSNAVFLYATAPVTFTFLVRPFSNSLESVLLAALFAVAPSNIHQLTLKRLIAVGAIGSLGVFTRVTFVAFAAPVGLHTLLLAAKLQRHLPWMKRCRVTAHRLQPLISAFVLTSIILIIIDSTYFSASALWSAGRIVVTPVNLLRYNMSTDNLAEHGLHPRYLHILINWPMLFGIGIWIVVDAFVSALAKQARTKGKIRGPDHLLVATLIIPTLLLSIQPHQEPRFLAPLIVPLSVLSSSHRIFTNDTKASLRQRRLFWSAWIAHSLVLTSIFGLLHQGGLLSALFALNKRLSEASLEHTRVNMVFWKTFMPPRHLLLPVQPAMRNNVSFRVLDLGGTVDGQGLARALQSLSDAEGLTQSPRLSSSGAPDTPAAQLLIAPAWAIDSLAGQNGLVERLHPYFDERMSTTFGVHLDMDRLDEMIKSTWDRSGVGVWQYFGSPNAAGVE